MLIMNGIHPGEPDGIDASMMLLRDLASGKLKAPKNVVIGIIPIYNIGGALNRNNTSRVNQNGPAEYGFRGNAQNLDLNRDCIKSDTKDARAFASIIHYLQPDLFIDNHVSDGADYQHTMTLLSTQHNKLGGAVGDLLHTLLEPALFKSMEQKGWPMCPYVNFEEANPATGWIAFYDPPRYTSGYTSLFQTIGFVPETHMLKPYKDRVTATYELMSSLVAIAGSHSSAIHEARRKAKAEMMQQKVFPLSWKVDSTRFDTIIFRGYEPGTKTSEVTGMPRTFYDHSRPFTKKVKYYNYFTPTVKVIAPKAYIIPQGWHQVIDLLRVNNVQVKQLPGDTTIRVEVYRIEEFTSNTRPYEKHHRNSIQKMSSSLKAIRFLKGDYIIYLNQPARRYLVEVLEPQADDSFFTWNFFDGILQQKEGYSDYRWEDVAAAYLRQHPEVRAELEAKKKADAAFATNAPAQLNFVYKRSPYYEPVHLRYPVYRLLE